MVFDSVSRIFTFLKQMVKPASFSSFMLAVNIVYEILVFTRHDTTSNEKYLIYYVLTDKWELKEMEITTVLGCSRLPNF